MLLDNFFGFGFDDFTSDIEVVGQARTSAAFNGHAHSDVFFNAIFRSEVFDLLGGFLGNGHRQYHAILGYGHIVLPRRLAVLFGVGLILWLQYGAVIAILGPDITLSQEAEAGAEA